MTTGRINQVAFLHGAGHSAHVATPTEGSGSGTRAGTAVVLSRDESSSRAETEGNRDSPARVTFCIRERDRRTVHLGCRNRRCEGHGRRHVVRPAPPRGRRARWDTSMTAISESGTQHRNPRTSPRGPMEALGYRQREDRGTTVRRSSAEPASPFDPTTTHARLRTASDNPSKRTACPRSSLSKGACGSTRRNRRPNR